MGIELEGYDNLKAQHETSVIRTLARYGRLSRQRLLVRLYDEQMLSFDLNRALERLRGKVITECENGKIFYRLR